MSAARIALALLLLPAAVWAAVTAALWWQQERLLFHPTPLAADVHLATEPDVHESAVEVPGARLSVLALRLAQPRGVVLFLHGNAGNLQGWFTDAAFYRRAGFDLVMPDYRGYGKSTGRIQSEAQLHADMAAVWRAVAPRYAGKRVVLIGRSIGTGLAARLAADIQPDLTVLLSPYASIVGLARERFLWLPPQAVRYPLRTDEVIERIRGPVLLLHGRQDEIIPVSESRKLQALSPRVRLLEIDGAGHNDLHLFPAYRDGLAGALDALR